MQQVYDTIKLLKKIIINYFWVKNNYYIIVYNI